jgi:hypothetical protein
MPAAPPFLLIEHQRSQNFIFLAAHMRQLFVCGQQAKPFYFDNSDYLCEDIRCETVKILLKWSAEIGAPQETAKNNICRIT